MNQARRRGRRRPALRVPTLETLFVAAVALFGLRVGLRPIGDNSMFVHIRTGADIVAGRGIPRTDPYSFTAAGRPWVVQSWFAATIYGLVRRLGDIWLVLLHGALYAAVAWIIATLSRAGTPVRTAAVAVVAVTVGAAYWSPRPLALGLVAMGLTVLSVQRQWWPWLLVPVVWVWANSHGSFALGGLWLLIVVVTGRRDARRHLAAFAAGLVLAALNPLGPRLLLFPLVLMEKRPNFARVAEWRPPVPPQNPMVVAALVASVIAVVVIGDGVRRRRLSVRDALPAAVFLGLGFVAQRNLAPASIVVAPVLATALRQAAPAVATGRRSSLDGAFAALIVATAALFTAVAAAGDAYDVRDYPPAAAFRAAGGAERIVSTDIVGCYRILLDGRRAQVFIDDRYDMYPEQVVADYVRLFDGRADSTAILDRYRAGAAIWPRDAKLAATLSRSSGWRRAFDDGDWVVYVRGDGR